MRNSFLSGLDLLKGSLWSMTPPEAMLVSVVRAAAPGYDETQDPRGGLWSVPLTGAVLMSLGHAALGAILI